MKWLIISAFLITAVFSGCNYLTESFPKPKVAANVEVVKIKEIKPSPKTEPQILKEIAGLEILSLKNVNERIFLYGLKNDQIIKIILGMKKSLPETLNLLRKNNQKPITVWFFEEARSETTEKELKAVRILFPEAEITLRDQETGQLIPEVVNPKTK